MTNTIRPHRIARRREGVLIEWEAPGAGPGHSYLYDARTLRLACRCAACVEEMSGRPILEPGSIPDDVWPVSIALVGAYGLRIDWSDGHGTGIYTFEHLLRDCGCERCRG
jgi:DUF971 family protein